MITDRWRRSAVCVDELSRLDQLLAQEWCRCDCARPSPSHSSEARVSTRSRRLPDTRLPAWLASMPVIRMKRKDSGLSESSITRLPGHWLAKAKRSKLAGPPMRRTTTARALSFTYTARWFA